jgi:hypothetical protein
LHLLAASDPIHLASFISYPIRPNAIHATPGSPLTAVQEKWVNRKPACPGSIAGSENAPAAAGSTSPNLRVEGAERNPSLLGGLGVRSREQGCRFLPQQGNVPRDDRPDQGVVDSRVLMGELIVKIYNPPGI